MNLVTFRDLLGPFGQEALQAAVDLQPCEVDFLGHFSALSRRFPADLARAALEIAILRREASGKFPFAERLYFTRPALEQASDYQVSTYRAKRFCAFEMLADLGCSVGGDTLALAGLAPTLGIDIDPLRLEMARSNLGALSLGNRVTFFQADLVPPLPLGTSPRLAQSLALFFDPARRTGGRRVYSVHDYRPPLAVIENWLPHFPALGVKISPGVKLDELRDYDVEVEFVSLQGELKEAVLWFGPLKTAQRRATVLPGKTTLNLKEQSMERTSSYNTHQERILPLSEPRAYLYEPDPSILRAGLVQTLGAQLNAAQLDPDIAYLTSDQLTTTPFARAWAIEAWFPFGVKRLRAALRQRGVGQVVVKKRGSPLQPDELIRALRLKEASEPDRSERVIFLTHLRGRPIVILCLP